MEISTNKNVFSDSAVIETNGLKGKVIRNMSIAKKLMDKIDMTPSNTLRVIDFKPDKLDPTHQRTVVVFEDNDKFQEEFSSVLGENRKHKDTDSNPQKQIDELTKKIEELQKAIAAKEG